MKSKCRFLFVVVFVFNLVFLNSPFSYSEDSDVGGGENGSGGDDPSPSPSPSPSPDPGFPSMPPPTLLEKNCKPYIKITLPAFPKLTTVKYAVQNKKILPGGQEGNFTIEMMDVDVSGVSPGGSVTIPLNCDFEVGQKYSANSFFVYFDPLAKYDINITSNYSTALTWQLPSTCFAKPSLTSPDIISSCSGNANIQFNLGKISSKTAGKHILWYRPLKANGAVAGPAVMIPINTAGSAIDALRSFDLKTLKDFVPGTNYSVSIASCGNNFTTETDTQCLSPQWTPTKKVSYVKCEPVKPTIKVPAVTCGVPLDFSVGGNGDSAAQKHVVWYRPLVKNASGAFVSAGPAVQIPINTAGMKQGDLMKIDPATFVNVKDKQFYSIAVATCSNVDSTSVCQGPSWSTTQTFQYTPFCNVGPVVSPTPCPFNYIDVWPKSNADTHIAENGNYLDIIDLKKRDAWNGIAGAPSCMNDILLKAFALCSTSNTPLNYRDDCMIKVLSSSVNFSSEQILFDQTYREMYSDPNRAYGAALAAMQKGTSVTSKYFDNDCKVVDASKVDLSKTCKVGDFKVFVSPISILIDQTIEEFEDRSVISSFKLQPGNDSKVVWKASEKAPLLVYDPTHEGKITSYSQLFGNWAFGGKVQASMDAMTSSKHTEWEDGYEALASLDVNSSGSIEGVELDNLALWFDENMNAVSEVGEVKSIKEIGIRALYYKDKVKNHINGDILVSRGYDREIDGKLQTGVTVDWYSPTGQTVEELLYKQYAASSFSSLRKSATSDIISPKKAEDAVDAQIAKKKNMTFSGVWVWKLSGSEKSESSGGVLVFSALDEKNYYGLSSTQLELRDSIERDFKSVMMSFGLKGAIAKNKGGEEELRFEHKNTEDGSVAQSMAKLSKDNQTLEGRTIVKSAGKVLAEYAWTAEKFKPE